MLVAIVTLLVAQQTMPIPLSPRRILLVAGLSLPMGCAMATPWATSPLASILYKFPFGALYAGIVLRLAAPDWFARSWSQLTKRLAGAF
jgi:hypothetical protein